MKDLLDEIRRGESSVLECEEVRFSRWSVARPDTPTRTSWPSPKIRHVELEAAIVRTPEDVAAWIDRTNQELLNQVKQGPIAIG